MAAAVAHRKVKSKPLKIESLQEYVARGGSINRVAPATLEPQPDVTRKTTPGGPATFLSLEEADLFFGEPSKKRAKVSKQQPKVDLDALPSALKAKFIAKLKEDSGGQGYEEVEEDISED